MADKPAEEQLPVSPTPYPDAGSCGPEMGKLYRLIVSMLCNDYRPPRKDTFYNGLAYYVRERLIDRWIAAQRLSYAREAKRVYYLSMEFLPGPFLKSYITNLDMADECKRALDCSGFTVDGLAPEEAEPGLGNGGLGRLASCYMDSMATLGISGYGYGIRYEYGIFNQRISNGWQVEESDNWLQKTNPWEIGRRGFPFALKFYGRSEAYTDEQGNRRYRWVDTETVNAVANDILIPGYGNETVNNMRLWSAVSSKEFNLQFFNRGDYIRAMEAKVLTENISKVLYPSDEPEQGKTLRLRQQYFLVAATFQDIMRRFRKLPMYIRDLPRYVAVQLNDTHPAISIPELMRILLDEEGMGWDEAWQVCVETFAYTNHTVMPEALERWPVRLFIKLFPRHLEIIYEINRRFLEEVAAKYPGDADRLRRMSIIEEGAEKKVRMAHLAIVGSHRVNGVAALHTHILKTRLFKDFDEFFPGRIINVTNGITPRRWLMQANPPLAALITSTIGPGWTTNLYDLRWLEPHAENQAFRASWRKVKRENKKRLAEYILQVTGITVDADSMFDIQTKRIHEYKRQLLNVLHVITLYNRMRKEPRAKYVPRTVIIAGKAAPGYYMAKLLIKLVNSVADVVNNDPAIKGRLKLVFLPNYNVSQAEKVVAAADVSEQISTAGMEASGTGNMKFSLNGAAIVGTLDGANVEIRDEVGERNIFIFGLTEDEVQGLRTSGYNPWHFYHSDPELREAVDMITSGRFSPEERDLFRPITQSILDQGDYYMVLSDYRAFINVQDEVDRAYRDIEGWTRRSILNTARMGKFSSDRAVKEYAEKIWGLGQVGI